jgi:acetyltransferase-like isoleucine patch superfamily enzyme
MDKNLKNDLDNANASKRRQRVIEHFEGMEDLSEGGRVVLLHPGARWYLKLMDRCKNNAGVLMVEPYTQELLENVVISPKVTIDDFDDKLGVLNRLTSEVESFLGTPTQ